MRKAGLDEEQVEIKIARRISITSVMQMIPYGRKWRGTKEPLDTGKKENEKADLKLNIQKTMIMASGLITSWQIEGGKVEAVTDYLFLSSQITADDDSSKEIKIHLRLGRKALTKLDSLLKSRDINLPTKAHTVKTMVFQ